MNTRSKDPVPEEEQRKMDSTFKRRLEQWQANASAVQNRQFSRSDNIIRRNDLVNNPLLKKIKLEPEVEEASLDLGSATMSVKQEQNEDIKSHDVGDELNIVTVTEEVDIPLDGGTDSDKDEENCYDRMQAEINVVSFSQLQNDDPEASLVCASVQCDSTHEKSDVKYNKFSSEIERELMKLKEENQNFKENHNQGLIKLKGDNEELMRLKEEDQRELMKLKVENQALMRLKVEQSQKLMEDNRELVKVKADNQELMKQKEEQTQKLMELEEELNRKLLKLEEGINQKLMKLMVDNRELAKQKEEDKRELMRLKVDNQELKKQKEEQSHKLMKLEEEQNRILMKMMEDNQELKTLNEENQRLKEKHNQELMKLKKEKSLELMKLKAENQELKEKQNQDLMKRNEKNWSIRRPQLMNTSVSFPQLSDESSTLYASLFPEEVEVAHHSNGNPANFLTVQVSEMVPEYQNDQKVIRLFSDVLKVFIKQGTDNGWIQFIMKMPKVLLKFRLICKSWRHSVDQLLETHPSHFDTCNCPRVKLDSYNSKMSSFGSTWANDTQKVEQLYQYFAPRSTNNKSYNPMPTRHLYIDSGSSSGEDFQNFTDAVSKYLQTFGTQIWYFTFRYSDNHECSTCGKKCPSRSIGYTFFIKCLEHLPNLKMLTVDIKCYGWTKNEEAKLKTLKFPVLKNLEKINENETDVSYVMLKNNNHIKKLDVNAGDIFLIGEVPLPNLSELKIKEICKWAVPLLLSKTVCWKPEKLVLSLIESGIDMKTTAKIIQTFGTKLESLEFGCPKYDWDWFDSVFNLPRLKHLKLYFGQYFESKHFDMRSLENMLKNLTSLETVTVRACLEGLEPAEIKSVLKEVEIAHKLPMWLTMPSLKNVNLLVKCHRKLELNIKNYKFKRTGSDPDLRFCVQHDIQPKDMVPKRKKNQPCPKWRP